MYLEYDDLCYWRRIWNMVNTAVDAIGHCYCGGTHKSFSNCFLPQLKNLCGAAALLNKQDGSNETGGTY